jgi:hypothetical protein
MRLLALIVTFLTVVSATAADSIKGEVHHEPLQPKPDVPVLVTAKLPAGTTKPVLKLQAVAPGKYIRKSDPSYEKDWVELPMRDDGQEGDAKAGDGLFSVRVPASYQKHRWLLRYRVVAKNSSGKDLRFPDAQDNCPNFAWWCDAGPAAWAGSRDPGKKPALTFSTDFLKTLQSLHLIARWEDVEKSQWDGNFHKQKQQGTLVYRGLVYDHILYSNRGQGSAHIAGKNKWGLKFNKGHDVPMRFHDGTPFPDSVDSLDLNPGGSTPYMPIHRGIAGLDEVLSMRTYRLAGVPAPLSTWIQWRVVTSAEEVSAKDQYAGDLWGLYIALGEMDPKLLSDHTLPNGLTVSTQSGVKHVPKTMAAPDAQKEWEKFLNGMRSNPKEEWWRKNLDLPAYFSFHAINRLVGNVDLRPDGNHGYYRHPDGRWAPIPWDMDMTFVPRHHQPGYIDAIGCLNHPSIALEFRNRAREILDLYAADPSPKGGQVGQLTNDLASGLTPQGFNVDWPRLDEARWNNHPRINPKNGYFVNPMEAGYFGGPFKRTLATADFAGFCKYLIDFCTNTRPSKTYAPNDGDQRGYGWGYLAQEAKDIKIPIKPTVMRTGESYKFEASSFSSLAGQKAAALEWRVGRIGKPGWYELADHWRTAINSGKAVEIPAEVFKEPGQYRVRARWKDDTGRCSHWSAPVEVMVK